MARRFLLEGPGCVCGKGAANLVSMEWLISQPSLLLWADTILVSQPDFEYVCAGLFNRDDQALSDTYALIFERLHGEGLITTFEPQKTIPRSSAASVRNLAISDIERFGTTPKTHVNGSRTPGMIETRSGSFCAVALENIYMNLLASNLLGCSCLMDGYKATFVKERFRQQSHMKTAASKAFDEMYSVLVPELNPHQTHYLFCPKTTRSDCANGESCQRSTRKNVNGFIDDVLLMRSKPEIQGLSSLIERIELANPDANPSEISRAVIKDISKAQRRLHDAYPAIKLWARIIGEVSTAAIGLALTSPSSDLTTPLVAATAIGGLTAAALTESKISADTWKIAYVDKHISSSQQ